MHSLTLSDLSLPLIRYVLWCSTLTNDGSILRLDSSNGNDDDRPMQFDECDDDEGVTAQV